MFSKCWHSKKLNIEWGCHASRSLKNEDFLLIHIFCKAIEMRLKFNTWISILKKVLFVLLFAILVSRVIIALQKLDNKELYAHSFSPKKIIVVKVASLTLSSMSTENECQEICLDDWHINLYAKHWKNAIPLPHNLRRLL